MSEPTCLIIGAGMSGLTAARELHQHGWRVQVIDKGKHAGGRLATRRHPAPLAFDHGAQFFTARTPEFQREVAQWLSAGWADVWFGDPGHERYRSTNGMNGLAARLAEGLEIRLGGTVRSIATSASGWAVNCDAGEPLQAHALIVTAPVPQAMALLGDILSTPLQAELARVHYDPCLALLAPLPQPSRVPEPGYLRLDESCLAVIADNTQKGISVGPAAVTLHSTADFARAHWESPPEAAAALMLEAARPHLGEAAVTGWQLHRWRYSQPATTYPSPCVAVETGSGPLVLAGDAFGGPRVEGAYLSGVAAARSLLERKL